jgi:SAM-dependent methyltransferase
MGESQLYDGFYYQTGCGKPYVRNDEWLSFFQKIADKILEEIHPYTVLDAGCAFGFLVEGLRKRDIEAFGIDISEYAIQQVDASISTFCSVASITKPFSRKFDLIVTIEVLEHLPWEQAQQAVKNLCQYTDDILFSSSPYDYREVTHYNVQPPEVWAELFAREGFYRDLDFNGSFLTNWAVRYRRQNKPVHRIVMEYERKLYRLVTENYALREVAVEQKDRLASNSKLLAEQSKELQKLREEHQKLSEKFEKLRFNLEAITLSMTYRFSVKLRGFWPAGSRREKIILGILKWTKFLR